MTPDAASGRLEIAVSHQDHGVVVCPDGDVDLDNADQLATALRSAATESAGTVILDLTGVPFMDSSGLKVLLVALREYSERLALAVTPGSPVMTLLELAEVRDRFTVHATADDALHG